jgi:hypothetical protein
MKRKPLAALAILAALPAAVIASAAIDTAVSTASPAAHAAATTYARLAATSNSGWFGNQIVVAPDCHSVAASAENVHPGETLTITITGDGNTNTVTTTAATITQKWASMASSTSYTVTFSQDGLSNSYPVTTPAC